MNSWQRDKETGEHFLPINDDQSWKVYKTAAGDYALTLHSDADGHGGDVEFFDTLLLAKKAAISLVEEAETDRLRAELKTLRQQG